MKLLNSKSLCRGIQGLVNETKEELEIFVLLPDKQIVKEGKEEKEEKNPTEGKKQAVTKGNQKGKYSKNKQINTKKTKMRGRRTQQRKRTPKSEEQTEGKVSTKNNRK